MIGAVLSGSMNIELSAPLKGSEIVQLVEYMERQPGDVYFIKIEDSEHPGYILLGQASELAAGNFLIASPDATVDGILPETEYDRLVIRGHQWPGFDAVPTADQANNALQLLWEYGRRLDTTMEFYLRQAVS